MNKNTLLTGFLGRQLCDQLQEKGFHFIPVVRVVNEHSHPNAQAVGDINGQTNYSALLGGVEVVVHAAADLLGGIAAYSLGIKNIIWGIRSTDIRKGGSKVTLLVRKLCSLLSYRIPKKFFALPMFHEMFMLKLGMIHLRCR